MGQCSVANLSFGVAGGLRSVTADVTFSSSYATGGDTITPASLGLQHVVSATLPAGTLQASQQIPSTVYTPAAHGVQAVLAGSLTAPKLKAYQGSTSEVANATNLSTVPAVRVEFRGI